MYFCKHITSEGVFVAFGHLWSALRGAIISKSWQLLPETIVTVHWHLNTISVLAFNSDEEAKSLLNLMLNKYYSQLGCMQGFIYFLV